MANFLDTADTPRTYDEMKDRVYEKAAERVDAARKPGVKIREALQQWDRQLAGSEAWWQYRFRSVCEGIGKMPVADKTPLTFSTTHTAGSTLGGWIYENMSGLPVTVEATRVSRTTWVVTVFENRHVVMTVDQAFRRGLREAKWPQCEPA